MLYNSNKKSDTCVFTIVAENYIGLAQILGNSLKTYNPEVDFKIIVADELSDDNSSYPKEVTEAKAFLKWSEERWIRMTFQYDLTQFCTSIKPGSLLYLMELGYKKVLYFDPDIFFYSSISSILTALDKFQIVLTPQISLVHEYYNGEHPEWAMNCNGIFNLGFGGFLNTDKVKKILRWWDKRLETECFSDRTVGNFTDQKWMDWIPGFMDSSEFSSLTDLGMNMAPWNFFERKIIKRGNSLKVIPRENNNYEERESDLVFIHFAGYDYSAFKSGEIKRKRIESLQDYPDVSIAARVYQKAIQENAIIFDGFIKRQYSYQCYDNGDIIEPFHRLLYHGLIMEGKDDFNPFLTGKNTFYYQLERHNLIDKSKSTMNLSRSAIGNISTKRKLINALFGMIKKVGGYKLYVPFSKAMIDYCRPEYHTFLIDKRQITK